MPTSGLSFSESTLFVATSSKICSFAGGGSPSQSTSVDDQGLGGFAIGRVTEQQYSYAGTDASVASTISGGFASRIGGPQKPVPRLT